MVRVDRGLRLRIQFAHLVFASFYILADIILTYGHMAGNHGFRVYFVLNPRLKAIESTSWAAHTGYFYKHTL